MPAARKKPASKPAARAPVDLGRALVLAFQTHQRIHEVLLDAIDPSIWRAFPPGSPRRNIATTFAHIHNVRCMYLKASEGGTDVPERLERGEVTREEARKALRISAAAMVRVIESALARDGRVRGPGLDVVAFVSNSIVHETHHRGQVCQWMRVLGKPLTQEQHMHLWEWRKRAKEVAG